MVKTPSDNDTALKHAFEQNRKHKKEELAALHEEQELGREFERSNFERLSNANETAFADLSEHETQLQNQHSILLMKLDEMSTVQDAALKLVKERTEKEYASIAEIEKDATKRTTDLEHEMGRLRDQHMREMQDKQLSLSTCQAEAGECNKVIEQLRAEHEKELRGVAENNIKSIQTLHDEWDEKLKSLQDDLDDADAELADHKEHDDLNAMTIKQLKENISKIQKSRVKMATKIVDVQHAQSSTREQLLQLKKQHALTVQENHLVKKRLLEQQALIQEMKADHHEGKNDEHQHVKFAIANVNGALANVRRATNDINRQQNQNQMVFRINTEALKRMHDHAEHKPDDRQGIMQEQVASIQQALSKTRELKTRAQASVQQLADAHRGLNSFDRQKIARDVGMCNTVSRSREEADICILKLLTTYSDMENMELQMLNAIPQHSTLT
jgi:chromosome segregation ATPase